MLNTGNITNYHNMYNEVSGNTNLRNLSNLQDINNISNKANGWLASVDDATKRERFIEFFYDKMLLDTIKLGAENNVFVKYCETKEVPQGNEKFLLRRWGGLTEHTYPLAEGIPPKSDKVASESFTGTYCSYGRYMEFTDRVDYMVIDPVIAHYSAELGDVAVRMIERLCRQELVTNAAEIYANGKTFDQLVIGDNVGIADYRAQALKFQRILVLPLSSGNYNVICSPEHTYDLVDDPIVDKYLRNANLYTPYEKGKPIDLFNIRFEETMLDDYAYGYTEVSHPGEYEVSISNSNTPALRLVIKDGSTIYYTNIVSDTSNVVAGNATLVSGKTYIDPTKLAIKRTNAGGYIKDGSYIPNLVTYDWAGLVTALTASSTTKAYTIAVEVWSKNASTGLMVKGDATTITAETFASLIDSGNVVELPVHRSFMFGKEFMVKTGVSGRMNVQFFVKEKGSAGVLDPINQRQSVGYKIDTLGFNTLRAEAMCQFIFVPTQALETYMASLASWKTHYNSTAANPTVNVFKEGTSIYTEGTESTYVTDPSYPNVQ